MARPKKELDWRIVEKKMEAGCSAKEIAGSMCDIGTFYDRFKEEYGVSFSNYSQQFYEEGNSNIRWIQYMKAMSGNIPMMSLLGRERLGQGKEEVQTSPFEDIIAMRHENMMLKAEMHEIKEMLNANKSKAGQELPGSDAPF